MLGVLVKIGSFMNSYVQYLVPSKDRTLVQWKVWCRVCWWWRSEPCFVNSHIAASGHLAQLEGWLLGEFTYWHLAQNETFCRTFSTQLEWFLARKISNVTDRIDVSCDTQTFSPTDHFWTRSSGMIIGEAHSKWNSRGEGTENLNLSLSEAEAFLQIGLSAQIKSWNILKSSSWFR